MLTKPLPILFLFTLVFSPVVLFAKSNNVHIRLYHGKESFILKVIGVEDPHAEHNNITLTLPEGTAVSMRVENPHGMLYDYAFVTAEVKEEKKEFDIGSFADLLKPIVPKFPEGIEKLPGLKALSAKQPLSTKEKVNIMAFWEKHTDPTMRALVQQGKDTAVAIAFVTNLKEKKKPVDSFAVKLISLQNNFKSALDGIIAADAAFPGNAVLASESGALADLLKKLKLEQSSGLGIFSPTLKDTLDAVHKRAEAALGTDMQFGTILSLLKQNAQHLLQKVSTLKAQLENAVKKTKLTMEVGSTPVAVRLKVSKKTMEGHTHERQTGDSIIVVVLEPEKELPPFSLVPMAFGSVSEASDIRKFGLKDSLISEQTADKHRFGAGPMLLFNAFAVNDIVFSLGLGLDISRGLEFADENMVLGVVASLYSQARIGIGVGWSQYPVGLKESAAVGERMPEDVANLDDLLDYATRPGFFIVFTLPGFNF